MVFLHDVRQHIKVNSIVVSSTVFLVSKCADIQGVERMCIEECGIVEKINTTYCIGDRE